MREVNFHPIKFFQVVLFRCMRTSIAEFPLFPYSLLPGTVLSYVIRQQQNSQIFSMSSGLKILSCTSKGFQIIEKSQEKEALKVKG